MHGDIKVHINRRAGDIGNFFGMSNISKVVVFRLGNIPIGRHLYANGSY